MNENRLNFKKQFMYGAFLKEMLSFTFIAQQSSNSSSYSTWFWIYILPAEQSHSVYINTCIQMSLHSQWKPSQIIALLGSTVSAYLKC